MGPFCNKKRVQDSFYKETLSFPNSCFSQADRKSSTRGRGQRTPTQRGSGEIKLGRSRIFLSNFTGSQEKREITTYNRSVQTEFLSEHSVFLETANKVRQSILPNDWAFSLDLTDAYLHVPIHWRSKKYLRFCIKGQTFQFKALPFGLATSPFVFTSLMVTKATHLRRRSVVLFPYLDDWLVRNQIRADILRDQQFTIKLISSLGLIINEKESDLIPAQNFVFIGMEFLTHKNIVRVPWDRVQDILSLVLWFKKQEQVSARLFLSLLGKLSAAAQFVVLGRLHLRSLQMALFAQWKPHVLPLEHCILINMQIKSHLEWWNSRERFAQGVLLKSPLPSHTLFTDASLSGWGAHLEPEGLLFHGVWSLDQSALHINVLEMKAILLALKQCHQHVNNTTVMIATDNSSVVAYLRKQGGTHSPSLCMEVWETLRWCDKRNINLLVRHVPGKTNILADRLSRLSKPISTEWCLDQAVCNLVLSVTGYPNIDLFATLLNNRLTTSLCFPYSRRQSFSNRRSINELGPDPCVRISSVRSDSGNNQQDSSTSVQNCSSSPILARSILIPRVTSATSSASHQASCKTASVNTTAVCEKQYRKPQTPRLDIVRKSIRDRSFSEKVAEHASKARRISTRKVYDLKWNIFSRWCHIREIDPVMASPGNVADFLLHMFQEKKCQVSTVKGYRSTISNTLKFKSGQNIGSDPIIFELIKYMELQRPVQRSLAPKWDLSCVLSSLCGEPFEPLHRASRFYLTLKTVFLLAMATARRVSEIHALSIDPNLCPVRAIKGYLKVTEPIRNNRTRLFLPLKGNHDINKGSISRWISYTIRLAYKNLSKSKVALLKIKAHELRALSASWSYFNKTPVEDVIKAAVWSSRSTFAKFYLRDLNRQVENLRLLGPVVSAQKVVEGPSGLSNQDC